MLFVQKHWTVHDYSDLSRSLLTIQQTDGYGACFPSSHLFVVDVGKEPKPAMLVYDIDKQRLLRKIIGGLATAVPWHRASDFAVDPNRSESSLW
jgi:hypothetical protein